MALNKEASRTSSQRAWIDEKLNNGIPLISPTIMVALGGLKKSADGTDLTWRSFKNVEWDCGGSSFDWRVTKTRERGTVDTGEFRVRDVSQPDLLANPTIPYYMYSKTWGIGEGDLEKNKNAGPQKIRNMKQDRIDHAAAVVNSELARAMFNANETGQNGGLSMFSPTNAGNGTTYAGIAMNASTTNGTDTFYYWRPTGYDYGSSTVAANLVDILGAVQAQATTTAEMNDQGRILVPNFGVFSRSLWPYVLAYYNTKLSIQANSGVSPANMNLYENNFQNIQIMGMTLYWDEFFGGTNGYIDASATEEILVGRDDLITIATTFPKSQGLVRMVATGEKDEALIAGQMGVVKTGMMALVFRNPRAFQLAYT